jgi:hypothetical protein
MDDGSFAVFVRGVCLIVNRRMYPARSNRRGPAFAGPPPIIHRVALQEIEAARKGTSPMLPTVNVSHETKGDKLVLTIDVSKAKLDEAGKLSMVATTKGYVPVGAVMVSLNVVAK